MFGTKSKPRKIARPRPAKTTRHGNLCRAQGGGRRRRSHPGWHPFEARRATMHPGAAYGDVSVPKRRGPLKDTHGCYGIVLMFTVHIVFAFDFWPRRDCTLAHFGWCRRCPHLHILQLAWIRANSAGNCRSSRRPHMVGIVSVSLHPRSRDRAGISMASPLRRRRASCPFPLP